MIMQLYRFVAIGQARGSAHSFSSSRSSLPPSPAGGSICARSRPAVVEWQGYAEADFVKVGPTQRASSPRPRRARRQGRQGRAAVRSGRRQRSRRASIRPRGSWRRPRSSSPICRPAASRPRSSRRRPISPTPTRRATRRKPTSRAIETLLKTGAATVQIVDQEAADLRSAQRQGAAAEAALAQLRAPMGREGEIKAQAGGGRGRARPRSPWRTGGLTSATSPRRSAASVADVLALPGETLAAGAPVVSILPPENIFVRFFVPEPALSRHASRRRGRDSLRRLSARSHGDRSRSSRRRPNTRRR